ncbi:MAG: class I SAM-dependent methyltransferase, partial [Chloroflexi bacterium]|nr:class I SAM-dependent methyltransferase [Chloroflexota bacterium]
MGRLTEGGSSISISPNGDVPRLLFSPIAADYDKQAQILCLAQYRRWHRFLLSRVAEPLKTRAQSRVLDMATGTGLLAADLMKIQGVEVVGADIIRPMLLRAHARAGSPQLVHCTAEALPFADASFDAVVFAYLLRYVEDVASTLDGLARLLKPGGYMAALEFAVPRGIAYSLWRLYTDVVLPAAGRLISSDWGRVGSFLGLSIRDFYRRHPEDSLLELWRRCGFHGV